MSLGQRNAKAQHETVGVQKQAVSVSTEFGPNDRVMTVDGFLGTVTAVSSVRGNEEYEVSLDGDMGGGTYTAAQITAAPHEAVGHHMASDDYPILQDILRERPDIATPKMSSLVFTPGQRVLTFDGLAGTVTACLGQGNSSFTGGLDSIYAVVLDNGMGGGEYSGNDLRPQTGVHTPIMHQAEISGSQMDGSFEDTSSGGAPGADYHEEGGDLQTGASLWTLAAADTQDKPWAEYRNPRNTDQSWKGEHQNFEPEHHPMARERHYPMGGGGDADHNSDGNPMPEDVSKEYEPPHLTSLNSLDPDFGFHVHASWADVREKAKRLRAEGHVRITEASDGLIIGEVKGDHHVYEAGLQRLPGKTSIQAWSCGCKWGAYHWGADDDMSRFAGRQCSHSLALQYEAMSRGMFGNKVLEDYAKPKWVPRQVVVKYDINGGENLMGKSSSREFPEISPMEFYSSRSDVPSLLVAASLDVEAAVNNSWGEPAPTDLQLAPKPFGATQQRDPKANPGATGWATHGDPENWQDVGPGANGADGRYASLTSANSFDEEMIFEGSAPDFGNDYEMIFEAAADPSAAPGLPDNTQDEGVEYENAANTLAGNERSHALLGEQPKEPPIPEPNLAGPGYPSGPKGGQGAAMPPGSPQSPHHQDEPGAEATLHDEPEGALPSTDSVARMMAANEALLMEFEAGLPMGEGEEGVSEDDEAVTPARTANVQSIIEEFQKSAGYIMDGGSVRGGGEGEFGDVAAAAKAHLAKIALKDYSASEQSQIINEGSGQTAKNLDRLQLEGTHYLEDDEDTWMS